MTRHRAPDGEGRQPARGRDVRRRDGGNHGVDAALPRLRGLVWDLLPRRDARLRRVRRRGDGRPCLFGRLSDHYGRKPPLAAALAMGIAAMAVFLLADDLAT